MKFQFSLIATAAMVLPQFISTEPIPKSARELHARDDKKDCLVNAEEVDLWVEDGLSRRTVAFSAVSGEDPVDAEAFCDYWLPKGDSNSEAAGMCGIFTNPQCREEDDGWFVDVSNFRGPAGDSEFHDCLKRNTERWMKKTGCCTGDPKFCSYL